MIAAVSRNRVIGKDNDLVWNLPKDMEYFKTMTKGHCVIMGRRNWESIPHKWRPLPNRTNIVVTRQDGLSMEGATIVNSIEEGLEIAKSHGETEAFIIGGGQIYELGIKIADRLYITEVNGEFDGDTFFPKVDHSDWREIDRKANPMDEKHDFEYDFVVLERKIKQ